MRGNARAHALSTWGSVVYRFQRRLSTTRQMSLGLVGQRVARRRFTEKNGGKYVLLVPNARTSPQRTLRVEFTRAINIVK